MTIKEFYENINGDYDDMLARLSTDALILHFIKRFPTDNTYFELTDAVQRADISASFEAAHKLKGIAANLSFSELFTATSRLCEQLRAQTEPANTSLLQKVSKSYHLVLQEIDALEKGGYVQ